MTFETLQKLKDWNFSEKRCIKCGYMNKWNAKYCAMCGDKI